MKSFAGIYKRVTEGHESTDNKGHWENDNVDGMPFEQKDKFYKIDLKFTYDVVDDSDYDRESGYGRNVNAEYRDTLDFEVEEMDEDYNKLRDTDTIKKNSPGLYKDLLRYAKEAAILALDIS